MVEDPGFADGNEISAKVEGILDILARVELSGDAEEDAFSGEVSEQLEEVFAFELAVVVPNADVKVVEPFVLEELGAEVQDVLGVDSEAVGGESDSDLEVGATGFTDSLEDFHLESGAVLGVSAVGVFALVFAGAEEGADDVAVGAVDFDSIESGFLSPLSSFDEVVSELVDFLGRESS